MPPDGLISIIALFLAAVGCHPVSDRIRAPARSAFTPECVATNGSGLTRIAIEQVAPPVVGAWVAECLRPLDRSHLWSNLHATYYFPQRRWVIGRVVSFFSNDLRMPGVGEDNVMRLALVEVKWSSRPASPKRETLLILLPEPSLYGVGSLSAHARPLDSLTNGSIRVLADDLRHTFFGNAFYRLAASLGPYILPNAGLNVPFYGIEVRSEPDAVRPRFRFGSLPASSSRLRRERRDWHQKRRRR